jgi:phosphoglycolate phosphatase
MAKRYSAVIFDLDGTLVDSYEPIAASLNHARAAFGLPAKPLDAVRREVGRGLEALMADNLGPGRVEEGVRLFRSRYRQVFREGTHLMPGVEATLRELAARGVPMAITSNKPAYFSREIVDALGLEGLFAAILGPEMVAAPKPHPEMVEKAAALLRASREEILYVGDMRIDIETCRNAGMAVCVLPTGSETKEALAAARPDHLIERFESLLDLLAP